MNRRLILALALGLFYVAGWGASSASAQLGFGPGGYGLGFFNYDNSAYGGNYRIPYYSLYPPVYYSYPVARTYGYSPFAYPPGTMTPEIDVQAAAAELKKKPASMRIDIGGDKSAASQPKMYVNPFVKQREAVLAKSGQ